MILATASRRQMQVPLMQQLGVVCIGRLNERDGSERGGIANSKHGQLAMLDAGTSSSTTQAMLECQDHAGMMAAAVVYLGTPEQCHLLLQESHRRG